MPLQFGFRNLEIVTHFPFSGPGQLLVQIMMLNEGVLYVYLIDFIQLTQDFDLSKPITLV